MNFRFANLQKLLFFYFYFQILEKIKKWTSFDHFQCTIRDALERLNELVDESDPDVDIPNIVHAFQTAEKIREDHPDLDWFHLTGLIHDLGKVKYKIKKNKCNVIILQYKKI